MSVKKKALPPRVVYRDPAPFIDRELQYEHEKNDISRLKGIYCILQVENLEKVAKTRQVGSFCRIKSK